METWVSLAGAGVMAAGDIDSIRFEFSEGFTLALKALVAVFLFGVALESKVSDFRAVLRRPWLIALGLAVQFALIPALTLLLLPLLDVPASVALGMIFIVCCPAGNLSNLLTHRARGDVALSVSMTTASNALALAATPLAFAFWGGLHESTSKLMRDVEISPWDIALEVGLLIGLPFAIGMAVGARFPELAARARRPVEIGTLALLGAIVVLGVASRFGDLVTMLAAVFVAVVAQNLLSLTVGYAVSRLCRLEPAAVRAFTLEMGIRNTALGLVMVLAFFEGLGGAAAVVAIWGAWDALTGLLLSGWWRRRTALEPVPADAGAVA